MIVFSGLFALFFYLYFIGTAWKPTRSEGFFHEHLGYIGKSMWLSWVVVVVSYWLDLPNLLWVLVPAAILLHVFTSRSRTSRMAFRSGRPLSQLVAFVVAASVIYFLYTVPLENESYTWLFTEWDAVVSWNRWGIELFLNDFNPFDAAYPVLLPGIWSLIYKAQGTADVWYIAKASLFILPIALVLTSVTFVEERLILLGGAALAFITFFFFVTYSLALLNGYMDAPVAAVMLVASCLLIVAVCTRPEMIGPMAEHLVVASVFVGLASITKQAGVMMLLVLVGVLLLEYRRKRATWGGVLICLAIASTPLVLFSTMYFSKYSNAMGNLAGLSELASQAAAGEGRLKNAFTLVSGMIPSWLLLLLASLAITNLVVIRHAVSQLGILFLACAGIGLVVFAECCSYDPRNGWWIAGLLFASSLCTLATFERAIHGALEARSEVVFRTPILLGGVFVGAALVAAILGFRYPDSTALQFQIEHQWKIGYVHANEALREYVPLLPADGVVISPYMWGGYLPGIGQHYRLCWSSQPDCVVDFGKAAVSLVFVGPGWMDYPDLRPQLTGEKLLGQFDHGYELYGPFDPGELHLPE